MKSKILLTLLVIPIFALLAIGCGDKADMPGTDKLDAATEAAGGAVDKMAGEAGAAFETLKKEYIAGAEKMITDWSEKLTGLETKKNAMPAAAQKPLESQLKTVKASKATLDQKFTDLKDAGADNFTERKDAFEGSLGEFKTGYDKLMGMF